MEVELEFGYIAKVYSIGKANKAQKLKEVNLSDKFEFNYMYNIKEEEYGWYVSQENYSSVYTINLDPDENESIKQTDNISDFIKVETPNKAVSFDKSWDKDDIKEFLSEANEEYLSNDEIVTEEVESNVESQKIISGIKKVSQDKSIVFSRDKYIKENEYPNNEKVINCYQYPYINIDNTEIRTLNDEIKDKFGFTTEAREYMIYSETEVQSYSAFLNGNILSVICFSGGNDSTFTRCL